MQHWSLIFKAAENKLRSLIVRSAPGIIFHSLCARPRWKTFNYIANGANNNSKLGNTPKLTTCATTTTRLDLSFSTRASKITHGGDENCFLIAGFQRRKTQNLSLLFIIYQNNISKVTPSLVGVVN